MEFNSFAMRFKRYKKTVETEVVFFYFYASNELQGLEELLF